MGPKKIVPISIAAACLLVVAVAAVRHEQVGFTAKCWSNGNGLSECVCTFNALAELPNNYRALAVSWAHDTRAGYAANVMLLIAAETWRVTSGRIERLININDRQKAIRSWVWQTGQAVGWGALKEAAPAVASKLAPVAAALPLIDDALGEYSRTQGIVGRHCGAAKTFIVQVYETRKAAEKKLDALTALAVEATMEAGLTAAETSTNVAVGLWRWVKSWF